MATAHIDFSPDCIREILKDRYLGRVDELMKHHYQVVNVWKPLNGPIRDWPLTLCHPHTVKADKDLQLMDRVFALNVEESIQIQYSPDQEWRFLKDQTPDEVLIFRGGDSELGMLGGKANVNSRLLLAVTNCASPKAYLTAHSRWRTVVKVDNPEKA